ncbi:MAG TPA: PqqD family protein [Candidatus Limnocylindrales bacterium]|nr:PqqD family protein [Candidatus Limnocylindrales bacterium]
MTTHAIPNSATVVAAPDLLASRFGDETVLLSLRDGVYYGLEDVGARVWSLLQTPTTLDAIRDAVVAEYSVEPARCERDLRALLGDMVARGLVEIREY